MARRRIKCEFDEMGNATFEGEGFEGDECIHEMKPFEDALGEVGEMERKPDNKHKVVKRSVATNKKKIVE